MVSEKIVVTNPTGLHLRPAGVLSKLCTGLTSKVMLIKGTKNIDAKSVLIIMSSAIKCGDEITVTCEGSNEVADLETVLEAIRGGLGE